MTDAELVAADCRDHLRETGATFDGIVTDPPYGIGIKGHAWDNDVAFQPETWAVLAAAVPDGYCVAFTAARLYHRVAAAAEEAGWKIDDPLAWLNGHGFPKNLRSLKPGIELALVARTGKQAIRINESTRFGTSKNAPRRSIRTRGRGFYGERPKADGNTPAYDPNVGRHPANVAYDDATYEWLPEGTAPFFYHAKASVRDRLAGFVGDEEHDTVKPINLMRWIVRLISDPDDVILDPFAGSGTTGIACQLEGRRFYGIERDTGHAEAARARIAEFARRETA